MRLILLSKFSAKAEGRANLLNFKGFLENQEVLAGRNVPLFVGKRHYVREVFLV